MNTMKKALVLVLALVAVIGLMTVCASAEEVEHVCGELTHYAEVKPTCHSMGNLEHWVCEECGKYYADAEGHIITTSLSVNLGATGIEGVEVTKVEAKEPTCHEYGNIEYYVCACGKYFTDAACTEETNAMNVKTGEVALAYIEAKDPTCHGIGNIEHYVCEDCGACFTSNEGEMIPVTKIELQANGVNPEKVEKVAAVEPTCCKTGLKEHYVCTECGDLFEDEACSKLTTLPAVTVSATALEFHEKQPATCEAEGVAEYYYCTECDVYYVCGDDLKMMPVASKSLVILPHTELTHVEAVEATCCRNGNVEYWYCEECGFASTSADGKEVTNLKNVVIPATHLTYFAEVPATCETEGKLAHYFCSECNVYYVAGENGNMMPIGYKSLTVLPHSNLTHVEAVAATCCTNGNVEYWYCEDCGFASTDAAGTELTNLKNVIIPATDLVYVEGVAATCEENGLMAHYYCAKCENYYVADENGNMMNIASKSLTIVPHSVGLTHVDAVAATCCKNGNVEFWYCEECGFASTSADGTELTNLKNVITPATDLEYVEEVAATATTNGMMAHYYCPVCDVYYIADDNGNLINIARLSLVIPAYGESDIPQTGLVWWPVAALSLAGAGMIAVGTVKSKKERDEE